MTTEQDPQLVFRALADPTRRAIISMLVRQAHPVSEIADQFDMTRPAIAKHLRVLVDGGLLTVQKNGRQRIHKLNPRALKSAKDWLSYFDHMWDERLEKLKSIVEKGND